MGRASLILIGILAAATLATSASGQESPGSGSQPLGTVIHGDRTIVFEPAKLSGAEAIRLKTWNDFAQEHHDVVRELGNHPSLVTDSGYLRRHPELDRFLTDHPDIRQEMVADPGNFIAPTR